MTASNGRTRLLKTLARSSSVLVLTLACLDGSALLAQQNSATAQNGSDTQRAIDHANRVSEYEQTIDQLQSEFGPYDQRLIEPEPGDKWLDADWSSVVRFDAPADQDGAIDAVLSAEMGRLGGLGARRIRFGHRTQDHPRNPTHRPRCMVVVEWSHQPPAGADLAGVLSGRFGGVLTRLDAFTGHRIYPWPDVPAGEAR
jgi:hypothetical protein